MLEVTVAGEPDPDTGMVLDLKELKDILEREVTQRLDHRHLNHEVPELAGQIPTCENIAAVIWRLLEPKITKGKLDRVRLYESPDLFADCTSAVESNGRARALMRINKRDRTRQAIAGRIAKTREADMARPLKISLTRRYRFAAAHHLAQCKIFSEEENWRLYGKCSSNPGMDTGTTMCSR